VDDDKPAESSGPVVIPPAELSAAALRGVIESFVLREGTDYGERDVDFETKIAQVRRQLDRGEARILFDPETESIDIVAVTGSRGR
jgi:uncharacterized protein